MPDAVLSIAGKLETAAAALIEAETDLTAYKGSDYREQETPCVVCDAVQGNEEPQFSGNYMMRLRVRVIGIADQQASEDTVATHDLAVADVYAALKWDNLGAQLSALATNFYAYDPCLDRGVERGSDGRMFEDVISFDVLCCTVDLT